MEQTGRTLTAVDLFCGAGGLSVGLKKAGFNVVAGVELNSKIAETYKANHRKTKLLVKDVRKIHGKDLLEATGLTEIDLVAGCPPCQGFTSLTSKYHREDPRNDLVLEMARIIEELNPKMVMMENVPGLAHRGKPKLKKFIQRLEALGYVVNKDVLQMADYGIPQSRRRLVLLAGKGFPISLPERTHCFNGDRKKKLKPWLTLADAIKKGGKPVKLSKALKRGGPQKFNWHVVKDLKEISKARLKALKAGNGRKALPQELRPKCHMNGDKGFANVYGRLDWNKTPPTMTSGCTTPCMGRFGHPDELRTISVREAATIQTFPKRYKFKTKYMNTACDLVGNALPPKFAQKVAKACVESYFKSDGV